MSIDKIKTVLLTVNDLEELKQISREIYLDTFSRVNSTENMQAYLNSAFSNEQLLIELKEKNSRFYFAKYNDETAGYFKINFSPAQTDINEKDTLELERIYVRTKFQGKRIGQKLLTEVIAIAKREKMKYLWLGVWEKNEKAIQFYKKNKFEFFGAHPFVMGTDTQTDYLMKLIL